MTRLVLLLALVLLVWLLIGIPVALLVTLTLGYSAVYLSGYIDGRRNRQTEARRRWLPAWSRRREPGLMMYGHRPDRSGSNGHVDPSSFRRKGGSG